MRPEDCKDWNDAHRAGGDARKAGDNAKQWRPRGEDQAKNSEGRGLKLTSFEHVTMADGAPQLVAGVIPLSGLTVIWGAPKSGKSFKTFDLVMHVARGLEYRGRKVKQGPVAYCIFEGQTGFRKRIVAYRKYHRIDASEWIPFWLMPTRLDLAKQWRALLEAIKRDMPEGPSCIVLDTLNRSLIGSESKDEDMARWIDAADALREEFDCAVIIVHHCGWDDTRSRGHSSLIGAVAAEISVKRDADKNVVLTVEEMRDGEFGDIIASRLEVVEVGHDPDGDPITSCVIVPTVSWLKPQVKVSGATKTALDLLRRAVVDAGETPPASNHIPGQIRVVRLSLWRRYCDEGIAGDRTCPDTKRKAFTRASQKLQSLGLIGVWGEYVWLADKPDKAGHL